MLFGEWIICSRNHKIVPSPCNHWGKLSIRHHQVHLLHMDLMGRTSEILCGGSKITPLADTQAFTVMWSLVPFVSQYACFVFLETTTFPVLLSMATMDSSQLKIEFGLFFKSSFSITSSSKLKCWLKTVIFATRDLPLSTLSGFLFVKFCLFLKFRNHLSPGPVSALNLLGRSLFFAIAQAKALTAVQDRGWLIDAI